MSLCINPTCNHQNTDNPHFCENCGSELLLNGKYRVVKQIGQGGFGRTYEIRSQHETHVLKVLIKDSPKAIELFDREAKVLQQIKHPGIVKATDKFLYPPKNAPTSLHCLVMEKIEGSNLREYIERKGSPIDGELALKWLKELLMTLNQLHQQNILHRDIKPDNIILDPFHNLFLIDFGAIKAGEKTQLAEQTEGVTETSTKTKIGTVVYTQGYAAPEQIQGQAIVQSDIYSLGCTFVYLLTGKEPNSEDNYNVLKNQIDWQKNADSVPPKLGKVIDAMIQSKAIERPENCQVILDQFLTKVLQDNQQCESTIISDYQGKDCIKEKYQGQIFRAKTSSTIEWNGISLKVTQEKLPASQIGLEIEIPAQTAIDTYNKVVKEIARNTRIPGFPKGKVPLPILLQRLDSKRIKAEVLEQLIQDTFRKVVEDTKIESIGNYQLRSNFDELVDKYEFGQTFIYKGAVDVAPDVTLGQYQGLKVRAEEVVSNPNDTKQNIYFAIIKELLKHTKIDLPQTMIEEEIDTIMVQAAGQIESHGIDVKQFFTSETVGRMREQAKPEAIKNLQTTLIIEKIAEQESITITNRQIDAKKAEIRESLKQGEVDEEKLDKFVKQDLLADKTLEWLREKNEVELVAQGVLNA